jgi:hypothetical protein
MSSRERYEETTEKGLEPRRATKFPGKEFTNESSESLTPLLTARRDLRSWMDRNLNDFELSQSF